MFTIHCPVAGTEVLRGPRAILSMHNTSAGVVAYARCQCGQIVVMVTGRFADEPRIHHPGAAPAAADDVATEPVPVSA